MAMFLGAIYDNTSTLLFVMEWGLFPEVIRDGEENDEYECEHDGFKQLLLNEESI